MKYPLKSMSSTATTPPLTEMAAEGFDSAGGIAQMSEQESRIDHIEPAVERRLANVQSLEPDITYTALGRLGSCQFQLRRVDIDAERLAAWRNPSRQLQCGVAATTAHVKAELSVMEAQTIEEG